MARTVPDARRAQCAYLVRGLTLSARAAALADQGPPRSSDVGNPHPWRALARIPPHCITGFRRRLGHSIHGPIARRQHRPQRIAAQVRLSLRRRGHVFPVQQRPCCQRGGAFARAPGAAHLAPGLPVGRAGVGVGAFHPSGTGPCISAAGRPGQTDESRARRNKTPRPCRRPSERRGPCR